MKRLLSLLLAALTLVPSFAGCERTDDEQSSASTTTVSPADEEKPRRTSPFGEAGLELMLNVIDDYYDTRRNSLSSQPNSSGDSAVWGLASYIEALAETYRLYPDHPTVKNAYIQALDECLPRYEVSNAVIQTPTGNATVTYYNASAGNRGDYYYDDDAWLCIQFLNAYELLGDAKYVALAEETLEFLWTGWDDVLGGGIYWDKDYDGKNTCANGPIAISFLWAYQLTEKADYLEKGKMIYDWTRETLLEDDLYCDSISIDGELNTWKAAYNQGVMIYAGAQLYEITGDKTYYDQTDDTVAKTIGLMFEGFRSNVKMKGNPIYKAWCVGWLVRGYIKFYAVSPKKNTRPMANMEVILNNELTTKDANGYYDPYFQTGDWEDPDPIKNEENKKDILQPCGITSVLCLTHYFITEIE